jgi:hypothetical protein
LTDTPKPPILSATFAEHLRQPIPEFLYHYTGQDGLLGIINSNSLWATDITYLNDSMEFDKPLRLLRNALQHSATTERGRALFEDADLIFRLQRTFKSICAACFCEDGDLLSQWRGYSSQGYGYSLEFNTSILNKKIQDTGFLLGKCIYDTDLQTKIIEETVQYMNGPLLPDYMGYTELFKVLTYLTFFKDESYKEEDEWRLVSVEYWKLGKMLFRRGKSMITPYTVIDIGEGENSSIHGVRIGPCPHMALSRASVIQLLGRKGHKNLDSNVHSSIIPFRVW